MAAQAVLKTLTPASASPKKQKRRFNPMMSNTFKRFLCAVMALLMLVVLLPAGAITAEAADKEIVDAAVIFTDLHTSKNDYKESTLKGVLNAVKNAGLPVSSVTSGGDAFSVNEDNSGSNGPYTGKTSTLTEYIQSVFSGVPVNYVWSDHDRYAVLADGSTLLDKTSRLVYGQNGDTNYYVYALSMGDLCSYDRYKAGFNYTASNNSGRIKAGFTPTVDQAIANFQATAATLDKSKPLFIVSHQPLFDNRNDNAFAEKWFDAINAVAAEMDVAFFYGHNHKYDSGNDYYYAKGSAMPVATANNWNYNYEVGQGYKPSVNLSSKSKILNFTHMCAGYLEPTSTGSYDKNTSRLGTVMAITIYDDSITYTTYNSKGVYNGNFAQNVSVDRDHAAPSHTHDYSNVETVDATCTEPGSITKTCSCGEKLVETIPALGHTLTSDATSSSCTTGGIVTYTCSMCSYSYTEEVAATGHNYSIVSTDATCTTAGSSVSTCSNCGDVITTEIPALGHQYTSEQIGGSCTTAGKTVYTCSTCNDTYTETNTATGHNYVASTVAPTCTEIGYTVYTCSNCGVYYNTSYVSAIGHTHTETVIAPTCTVAGYTKHTCITCGQSTTSNTVAALGHTYSSQESGNSMVYTCANCGHSYSEAIVSNHTYNKVTKFTANKDHLIVLYSNKKYYALSHKDNEPSVVEVTVVGNRVTSRVTQDLLWKYNTNKKLFYTDGNTSQYLNSISSTTLGSNPTLDIDAKQSANITYSANKLKVGTRYLSFANNDLALRTSGTTIYLFQQK